MPAALITAHSTGGIQSGEGEMVMTTTGWGAKTGTLPAIIWCHNSGTSASTLNDPGTAGLRALARGIAQAGYPVVAQDQGGTGGWGNTTVQTRIGQQITYAESANVGAKAGKHVLVSVSMNTIGALNYARSNPTKVSCIVGILPVIGLDDVYQNNRGSFRSAIGTAWGVTFPTALPANSDPNTSHSGLENIPQLFLYPSDDAVGLPSITTAYATAVGATATSLGAVGHTDAALGGVDVNTVISFINANA